MKNVRYMSVAEKVQRLETEKKALLADFKEKCLTKIYTEIEALKEVGISMTLVDNINKGSVNSPDDRRLGAWINIYNPKTGGQKRIKPGDFIPDGYQLAAQSFSQ